MKPTNLAKENHRRSHCLNYRSPLKWTVRSTYLLQLLMPARMRGRLVTIIHPFALCFSIISLFLFELDEAW